jgi:hypothetical protein
VYKDETNEINVEFGMGMNEIEIDPDDVKECDEDRRKVDEND